MGSNPFSSRFIRPGAAEYLFSTGFDVDQLLARFRENRFRGQILGPHGTGKSTLVWTLKRELERLEAPFVFFCFHANQRPNATLYDCMHAPCGAIIIIDGFEQLTFWKRWLILFWTGVRKEGLIVTGHRRLGLPILWETAIDANRAVELANRQAAATGEADPVDLDPEFVRQLFKKHAGNLREVYFDLYDYLEDANFRA